MLLSSKLRQSIFVVLLLSAFEAEHVKSFLPGIHASQWTVIFSSYCMYLRCKVGHFALSSSFFGSVWQIFVSRSHFLSIPTTFSFHPVSLHFSPSLFLILPRALQLRNVQSWAHLRLLDTGPTNPSWSSPGVGEGSLWSWSTVNFW